MYKTKNLEKLPLTEGDLVLYTLANFLSRHFICIIILHVSIIHYINFGLMKSFGALIKKIPYKIEKIKIFNNSSLIFST